MRSSALVALGLAGALLASAGCGKKAGAGDAPDCGQLGATLVTAMKKAMADSPTIPAETKKGVDTLATAIKDRIVMRCTDDKWPPEVRACMSEARGDDGLMRTCSEKMPKELRDKFEIDMGGKHPVPADQAPPVEPAAPGTPPATAAPR
jgi:hypothetical protein